MLTFITKKAYPLIDNVLMMTTVGVGERQKVSSHSQTKQSLVSDTKPCILLTFRNKQTYPLMNNVLLMNTVKLGEKQKVDSNLTCKIKKSLNYHTGLLTYRKNLLADGGFIDNHSKV